VQVNWSQHNSFSRCINFYIQIEVALPLCPATSFATAAASFGVDGETSCVFWPLTPGVTGFVKAGLGTDGEIGSVRPSAPGMIGTVEGIDIDGETGCAVCPSVPGLNVIMEAGIGTEGEAGCVVCSSAPGVIGVEDRVGPLTVDIK
jgi:hypothetical protein